MSYCSKTVHNNVDRKFFQTVQDTEYVFSQNLAEAYHAYLSNQTIIFHCFNKYDPIKEQ